MLVVLYMSITYRHAFFLYISCFPTLETRLNSGYRIEDRILKSTDDRISE